MTWQPHCGNAMALQKILLQQWTHDRPTDPQAFLRGFRRAECSWFSQNGEDGILLWLLSQAGREIPETAIEIGAGDGWENNCLNLAAHQGYETLLIDPSWQFENVGFPKYAEYPTLAVRPPDAVFQPVEPDDVDETIRQAGYAKPLGVLSIDIDGNDFWVWRAITVVEPAIVVCELNTQLGLYDSVALPYERSYDYWGNGVMGYHGASIRAYDLLARSRGLVFAGADRLSINGFWVRAELFPAVGDGIHLETAFNDRVHRGVDHFASIWPSLEWIDVTEETVAPGLTAPIGAAEAPASN